MRVFFVLSLLFFIAKAYSDSDLFLSSIPVKPGVSEILPQSENIHMELESFDTEKMQEVLSKIEGLSIKKSPENRLNIILPRQQTLSSRLSAQHSDASFVIDLEEESTKHFLAGFNINNSRDGILREVVKYASSYIDQPTYIHSFNIASKVAEDRSGDCTEYAVLTTALARSQGIPARVVIGTVIFEAANSVKAGGHAWTEVWYENKWQILDAAMFGFEERSIFYLPTAELENEGPGYAFSLYHAIQALPASIEILTGL